MQSASSFYESGWGDRLADPSNYPQGIIDFLQQEEQVTTSTQACFDLLIEVGCGNGHYLDWAVMHNKKYIGVDIVERYIQVGRQRILEHELSSEQYRFMVGDGERLMEVIKPNELGVAVERCVILFPFNSFGNMRHPRNVLTSLQEGRLPFLISSYQTGRRSTACRQEYYKRCGYQEVHVAHTWEGVCFTSAEGLYSMAYRPSYLCKLCERYQLQVLSIVFSNTINTLYLPRSRSSHCIDYCLSRLASKDHLYKEDT